MWKSRDLKWRKFGDVSQRPPVSKPTTIILPFPLFIIIFPVFLFLPPLFFLFPNLPPLFYHFLFSNNLEEIGQRDKYQKMRDYNFYDLEKSNQSELQKTVYRWINNAKTHRIGTHSIIDSQSNRIYKVKMELRLIWLSHLQSLFVHILQTWMSIYSL